VLRLGFVASPFPYGHLPSKALATSVSEVVEGFHGCSREGHQQFSYGYELSYVGPADLQNRVEMEQVENKINVARW